MNTTKESIRAKVLEIIEKSDYIKAPDQIEDHHELIRDLRLDSLDVIETVMELEKHYDISIPDDPVSKMNLTLSQLVNITHDLVNAKTK